MRYTVLWTPDAEQDQDLAAAWLNARDREAVTRAAHALEVDLRDDAYQQGESREGNVRILFESPLAIHFEAAPDDGAVFVLTVWTTRRDF